MHGTRVKNDRQEEWAVEGGAQYKGEHAMWNNSTAFYSGFHVRSFEETDWDLGISGSVGLHIKRDPTSTGLLLTLEAYTGRAILGEFALDYDESYIALGIQFDFY